MKNIEKYWDTLELFAKMMKIKVTIKLSGDDGYWNPNRREIVIDPDMKPEFALAVFLHELGHAFDGMKPATKKERRAEEVAYGRVYDFRHNKKQKAIVIACEQRAWDNGKLIANLLRIPLGRWFKKTERDCMKWYRKEF